MALIAGASQYVNQAAVSNKLGLPGQQNSLLVENGASTVSLLDLGRQNAGNGIGLSASARALNDQFLQQNSSTFNQLFSLSGGGSATVDAAQIQILGLRSSVPASREVEAPEIASEAPSTEEAAVEAAVEDVSANAEPGSIVDQEV